MDFSSALKGGLPSLMSNMTAPASNTSRRHLEDGMAHLLPLLGTRFNPFLHMFVVVYDMLGSRLGLDPTVILTVFGFLWAVNKVWRQIYTNLYGLVQENLMARIHVSSSDEIYLHLMKWLAQQPEMVNSRSLTAETVGRTAWEDEDESDVLKTRISADGSGVYLNFSNQEAKAVGWAPGPGVTAENRLTRYPASPIHSCARPSQLLARWHLFPPPPEEGVFSRRQRR